MVGGLGKKGGGMGFCWGWVVGERGGGGEGGWGGGGGLDGGVELNGASGRR